MNLPKLMLVSTRHQMKPSVERSLERALRGGKVLFQLREKDLEPTLYSYMAQVALTICQFYESPMVINGRPKMAQSLGVDGLHLSEEWLEEAALPESPLKGVSVHSVETAKKAQSLGADYVVFGSVFETASHSDQQAAGLDALRQVCQAVPCPVYAIGGVSAENAKSCLDAGAHGVAVVSAVWQAADITLAVQQLLEQLG